MNYHNHATHSPPRQPTIDELEPPDIKAHNRRHALVGLIIAAAGLLVALTPLLLLLR
jgi:hypothetical protein